MATIDLKLNVYQDLFSTESWLTAYNMFNTVDLETHLDSPLVHGAHLLLSPYQIQLLDEQKLDQANLRK